MLKRTLTITFTSDWQIGSGAGIPGSVDRQVLRDTDGLPYIPAKTLTGILRDAAEWLVENGGKDKALLEKLFGRQIPDHGGEKKEHYREALLSVRPARIEDTVRGALRKDKDKEKVKELIKALFIVQPHVKIDPHTGRAQDDHLFSVEQVRSDVSLEAELFLDIKGDKDEAACKTFLEDVVKAVRRIGGKRRRGAGRCALAWKEDIWDPNAGAAIQIQAAATEIKDGWVRIPMTLEALEMLQIHRETLGNAVETRDYIPGYLVLPHIARATGVDVSAFLARGELQVSDFLPEVDNKVSMPTPHCLFKPKMGEKKDNERIDSKNPLANEIDHVEGEKKDDERIDSKNRIWVEADTVKQLVGLRTGYVVTEDNGQLTLGKTDELLTVRMHNTIQDDVQRPDEDVGGVFSYGAVQRGAKFRGELRCTKTVYEALKGKSFSGDMRLGISKKDDYGRVRATCAAAEKMKQGDIHLHKGDLLVVYLESDVLVRDDLLAYSANPEDLKKAIEKELPGIGLELRDSKDLINAIGRGRRHEGWQTKWQLPRPSLVALQAGSVYVFYVTNNDKWDAKKAGLLLATGIGERRAEGFGRVQFNPSWLLSETIGLGEISIELGPTVDVGEVAAGGGAFLKTLSHEKWKRLIRREARRCAFDMAEKRNFLEQGKGPKTPSQWGSLRMAVARITDDPNTGMDSLLRWVNSEWPPKRKDNWDDPKGKTNLRGAIKSLAEDENKVWQYLGKEASPDNMLKKQLRHYAVRTLLDYTCEAVFDWFKKNKGGN